MEWTQNSVGFYFANSGDYRARIAGGGYLWTLEIWHCGSIVHSSTYHPTNVMPNRQTLEDAKRQFETYVFENQTQPVAA